MTDGGHLDPAGPQQEPPKRRGLPLAAILGIVGGGLVVLLVVVIAVAVTIAQTVGRGGSAGAGTTTSAKGVLRSYLTAIAAGDATKAKRFMSPTNASEASTALLTSDVLAQSKRLAPISHIVIGKATGSTSFPDIAVRYSVGSKAVSTSYHLSTDQNGSYTVVAGLARFDAGFLKGLDVTINGTAATVPDAGFQVFPGAYEVAVATPSLTLDGTGDVVLDSPEAYVSSEALKPKLSDEGLKRFRALVAASVTSCLKQTTLKAGCGLSVSSPLSDGTSVDQGSVQRTSTPQLKTKLAHLDPTPDLDTPTLMTASVGENPKVTATGTHAGQHGRFDLLFGPSFGDASIDVSEADPEVQWG